MSLKHCLACYKETTLTPPPPPPPPKEGPPVESPPLKGPPLNDPSLPPPTQLPPPVVGAAPRIQPVAYYQWIQQDGNMEQLVQEALHVLQEVQLPQNAAASVLAEDRSLFGMIGYALHPPKPQPVQITPSDPKN